MPGHHHAEVDDLVVVAAENDPTMFLEFGDLMTLVRQQARRTLHGTAAWFTIDRRTFDDRVQAMCDEVRRYAIRAETRGAQETRRPTATFYTDASTEYIGGIRQCDDAMFIIPINGDDRTIQTAELLGGIIGAIILPGAQLHLGRRQHRRQVRHGQGALGLRGS